MNDRHAISPYPIRMPSELRQRLDESARNGSRSLHAEIISRLEESFASHRAEPMGMGELVNSLIEMGRQKGLSVEVSISQDDENVDETTSLPMRMTTGINKDILMGLDEAHRAKDGSLSNEKVGEALRRAFQALGELDQIVGFTATPKGPKPRKRYPKE
ncbi:Arc family DNA-binding protein [Pseudomonas extremaustralis]|uniref:Arc family DNA-binding protein n=1 Tax=Pseudomonas extremaustralis TaxID=359110 RepID=UPI0023DECE32|nr:Arc family DNA-binding protein [Pseudomonas extremaustralis]MDF3136639.1 Arc family DNA-binding protein [Pseudomonas extremaustralis]